MSDRPAVMGEDPADGYAVHSCPGCGRTTEGWAWGDNAPMMTCYGCGMLMDLVRIVRLQPPPPPPDRV